MLCTMSKRGMPLAAMERLLKDAGADRVSDKAKERLRLYLEQRAEEIATAAIRFAQHAGRKTVKEGDIRLATKR
jgi:DNA-binding protein